MDSIVNTLFPVFFVIALGVVLHRSRFLGAEFFAGLNRLTYWVGLPVLLFSEIATARLDMRLAGKTGFVVVAATILVIGVGYLLARIMKVRPGSVSSFVHCAFRGNLAYIGLPIAMYALDAVRVSDSQRAQELSSITAIVLAGVVPIYNILAVVVLLAGQGRFDRSAGRRIVVQVSRNPLFIACIAGIIYAVTIGKMPTMMERTVGQLARMALPLALISVGAALSGEKITGNLVVPAVSTILKIVVTPLLGLGVAMLIGLSADETRIALLLLACPTAISAYVMTDLLGGDSPLSATIIVLTSLFSVLSLAVILAVF